MIDIKVKIHDKFSFEFKISFIATRKTVDDDVNEFSINTWMFVPNNLDINRSTYSKEQFYKDTQSNVRLITPIYGLKDIYASENSPLSRLQKAFENEINNPDSPENISDYTFQIKMFSAIFKSASRDKAYHIVEEKDDNKVAELVRDYIHDVSEIARHYRKLEHIKQIPSISEDLQQYFSFGDDFIGNIIQQQSFRIMRGIENRSIYEKVKPLLLALINSENEYKRKKNYSLLDTTDPSNNYLVVMRRGILKKFIESDLFLYTKKTKDGALAEQFYYGIAAAVSMIFATVVSFSAQLHYGNFTTPLFFALVISYVFKDRIKDLMRYYFSTQLGKKYYDTKRELEIQDKKIGWTKEAFDFAPESKVPAEIMNIRKRTPLVEAENRIYNEQIILYKKLVNLSSSAIKKYKGYQFVGINDVTRFNLTHFIQKMDNEYVPIYVTDEQDGYIKMTSEKVYALHFILRCQGHENLYFRKFRLLFNRGGIKEITEIYD
ncbi:MULTISPECIES: hypothetical protein [unclassified Dysgonomonas]|uniref:hypothetical protein n=1 Tax=unclassified Dysgonomonas TaxID=2630389 RepID=UPI0006809E06|nr:MULTISPECIES: hypothetical protein [unclassified Dysgonomonas]MBD8347047.1 hypothetical protein [Dysgonomonas sp. HGC4]MBF0574798.1 hypothetical protein [Dysgonomonas sp. GY617]